MFSKTPVTLTNLIQTQNNTVQNGNSQIERLWTAATESALVGRKEGPQERPCFFKLRSLRSLRKKTDGFADLFRLTPSGTGKGWLRTTASASGTTAKRLGDVELVVSFRDQTAGDGAA